VKNLWEGLKEKFKLGKYDRLVKQLLSMEGEISPWVVENLSSFTYTEISQAIKEAFPVMETYMQKNLLFLLEGIGYIQWLTSTLESKEEEETLFALEMIQIIRPLKALGSLVKCLGDKKESIRFEAASALIAYRDKKVVEMMVKELKETSSCMPARVAQVLTGYGALAVSVMLDNLENPDLDTGLIIEILSQIQDERIPGYVVECLDSENAKTRIAAVKYMFRRHRPQYLDMLKSRVELETHPQVCREIIKGLNNLGTPESLMLLQDVEAVINQAISTDVVNSLQEVSAAGEEM